jgi:hypothetical protein
MVMMVDLGGKMVVFFMFRTYPTYPTYGCVGFMIAGRNIGASEFSILRIEGFTGSIKRHDQCEPHIEREIV